MRTTRNAKTDSGFTLVEMLVVIAITAVLLVLLVSPLVNSFRLTQRAQMLVAAQDEGRITLENMSRLLGSAAYVFSNTTNPFPQTIAAPSGVPNLQFSNFLVMDTIQQNTDGTYTDTPALAFNAKLDFVLPRHNDNGNLIDPTTGEPVTVNPATGSVAPTGLTFPLAPGTTMARYWVGLRDPTKPYGSQGDGSILAGNGDNPYVLYYAEFNPTNVSPKTGMPAANSDGSTVNENLFNPTPNAAGAITSASAPEFDDPNFFRDVTTTDTNWLSPTHADYTSAEVTSHNDHVAEWAQIAKPVIGIPNVDLILLPSATTYNAQNDLAYDSENGVLPNPVAHTGAVQDPVTGTAWPVVNTSVTFKFGTVEADASGAATTNDAGAGFGGELAAADAGLPYVPTIYTATDQSWAFPYNISLYEYSDNFATYQTVVAGAPETFGTAGTMTAGDMVESMYTSPTDPGTPVYDLDNQEPLTTTGSYVPMSVTPDTGTINFDMPALPVPPTANNSGGSPYARYWSIPNADFDGTASPAGVDADGTIDLSTLPNSPLPSLLNPAPLSGDQIANARIVPGSLRVYGPDGTPGLSTGQSVLYTEVDAGDSDFGPNEYTVNYTNNTITLYIDPAVQKLPYGTVSNGSGGTTIVTSNVQVAFDYQANLAPSTATAPISASAPALPDVVKVAYQTRDLLDINLGIRVYDPSNQGPATVVTEHNQVHVGNSNR